MTVHRSASSRFHALLGALMAVGDGTLRQGWSHVLDITEAEVQFGQFALPLVAELVARAGDEAVRAEEQVGLPLRTELVHAWSRPVYAPGSNLDGPIRQQEVLPEALAYLDSVASVLRRSEKHEALPEGDELTELLGQVSDLAASVEASTELTDDVRQALLRRIAQVRFAIENARIGGAEGVQEAVEQLLGAAAVRSSAIPRQTINKVLALVATAYMVFSAGPTVQASLEAWPQVVETLTPGSEGTQSTEQQDPPADKTER